MGPILVGNAYVIRELFPQELVKSFMMCTYDSDASNYLRSCFSGYL